MHSSNVTKEFWEKKILPWEFWRYSKWMSFYPLSWTIRHRLHLAAQVIRARLPKGTMLELGCGSGILAAALEDHLEGYEGIDIAENAIRRARQRIRKPSFIFHCADTLTCELPAADLTTLLGLTDWLDTDELRTVLSKLQSKHILLSYTSAARHSPYRLYRKFKDGSPQSSPRCRARTFQSNEICDMLEANGFSIEHLSFPSLVNPGALVWASRLQ